VDHPPANTVPRTVTPSGPAKCWLAIKPVSVMAAATPHGHAERLTAQSRPVTNPHTWRAEPIQRPNTDQLLAVVQILDSQD
jgi:hypothetical protein